MILMEVILVVRISLVMMNQLTLLEATELLYRSQRPSSEPGGQRQEGGEGVGASCYCSHHCRGSNGQEYLYPLDGTNGAASLPSQGVHTRNTALKSADKLSQ